MRPRRILVCRLRALGDVIRTFPAIAGLRDMMSADVEIDYLCQEEAAHAACLLKDVNRVHILPPLERSLSNHRDPLRISLSAWSSNLQIVRKLKYDTYVDFHGVFYSALFGVLAGIPDRVGFDRAWVKDGSELCYSRRIQLSDKAVNRFDRHSFLVRSAFPGVEESKPRIAIPVQEEPTRQGKVVFCPGSSDAGILKRWPAENYADLAKRIAGFTSRPVTVTWGPHEEELAEQVVRSAAGAAIIAPPTNVKDLFHMISSAGLVVGNDGAQLHIASVLQRPCLMILGPTDPNVNAPSQQTFSRFLHSGVDCSPCPCWDYECPNEHRCMRLVTVSDVASELYNMWQQLP